MTSQHPILFNDGHAYERAMGIWSQLVGHQFLDWLDPPPGRRWLDVGCGNGAFTELLVQRRNAAEIVGIDPSEGQLAFAHGRSGALGASFFTATPWQYLSQTTDLRFRSWRSCSSSCRIRQRAFPK
jgi:ubiquinone/menaquinone biosynthesis C-methylase UbiE